ncbi:MAG: InlB B-repeat-containing protein [Clostridia bacterium]|nr:InlB B-repeat-containing protein [Clostridia bacterium]
MKKLITFIFSMALVAVMTFGFAGCFGGGGSGQPADTTPKEYTIQYTDDAGTHQITVTEGMPYSLDVVPEKAGYVFTGLYDAESGGTQYVSSNGSSLSPFNDGKNMVLFPQFKAKDYTVILDYQGAQVTGSRQLSVAYGSNLPELPQNLSIEHCEFTGWYTKENCGGTQVADRYGLIPVVSVLNENNFDLSEEYVYLYAGFEVEKFTVTCYFGDGIDTEKMQIEYDTPVSQIVSQTRVNGEAPLTWSKTQAGEVFNGRVTGDMSLYAVEYAPVIELDVDGGDKINPVVARAGSTISLPAPSKDLAKFLYWEDMQGGIYSSTTMPSKSISLKAVWQAKLVFDTNGGSAVNDISQPAGVLITLPTPEKDGYIFAGWYTADKEQYISDKMPAVGIALKAGWYKEKTDTTVVISSTSDNSKYNMKSPSTSTLCYTFDYAKYFEGNDKVYVTVDWHVRLKTNSSGSNTFYVDFYSQKQISSNYLIETKSFSNITNSYRDVNFSTTFMISDNFYLCWYSDCWSNNLIGGYMYLSDFYYTVHYPDTANLYL